ncbi:MAG: hypothetical protein MJZ02_09655 [Paludibacteraceae bacterium]|nr:hypothetical protein [Paludibacteraceae bacterium]
MKTAYYNDGNKEDAAKFYLLTAEDANQADVNNYMAYIYNVTKIQTFIKGLFKYTLYEDGWNEVDDSKHVFFEDENPVGVECSKKGLFDFFMQQLGYSIAAEQKSRDTYNWQDTSMREKVLASLKHIVLPDYNNWRRQMEEHNNL